MTEEADEALDSIFQSVLAFIFYAQFTALQGSISCLSPGFSCFDKPSSQTSHFHKNLQHPIIAFWIFFVYFLYLENDVKGNKK